MHAIIASAGAMLLTAVMVSAAEPPPITALMPAPTKNIWRVCWVDPSEQPHSLDAVRLSLSPDSIAAAEAGAVQTPRRPVAIEYSDGYLLRRKIHKYASFATLPLFATEFALGQSMFNNTPADNSSKRTVHAVVGAGIVGLFGVNTVTGA
jgi:hypothetical protein